MNFLNRVLMIVITLLVVAAVTLCAAMPAAMMSLAALGVGQLKGLADRLLPAGRLLVAVVGLALDLVLLFWLWLEVRRTTRRTVQVSQTDGALAEVTTNTLAERLELVVDALPGVVWAKARVKSYGRSVAVTIEAEIAPDTPVANTADRVAATVRGVVENTMGLKLKGKPRIRIKAIRLPEVPPEPPEPPSGPPPDAAEAKAKAMALPAPEP